MRYLVIGDAGSMHIYNFVKSVLLPAGYEVHLLTLSARPVRAEYYDFYKANNVTVHSIAAKNYRGLEKTDPFHRLLNIRRKLRLMSDVPKVDICHVHSVYKTAMLMVLRNRKKYRHLILSYWGGDVEDKAPTVLKLRERAFRYADVITVTVEQALNDFRTIHGKSYDEKLRVSRFATDGINCIHELAKTVTRSDCRASYDIPDGKICITCGYSAYREQHQDKCLEIINKLPKSIRDKLCVIVPMQYGRFDQEYIKTVSDLAKSCDYDCRVLHDYVPFEMSARLAIATDIYLHLRDTDAFSNSLKEQVYAGSKVITGKWLKYIELEKMNAPVTSISSFDELERVLSVAVENYSIPSKINLFEPMYELYSRESVVSQWNQTISLALE